MIMRTDGKVWTGSGWSQKLTEARRYAEPLDAYDRCAAESRALRATGERCSPTYFPPRVSRQERRSAPSMSQGSAV